MAENSGIGVFKGTAVEGTLVIVSMCRTVGFVAPLVHSLVLEYRVLKSAFEDTEIRA